MAFAWLAFLVPLTMLCGPASASADVVRHRYITIGTGSPSGVYFAAGNAICEAVNRYADRRADSGDKIVTYCRAGPSGGSVFNIKQVATGAFTFVIAQSNDQRAAVNGSDPERIRKVPDLRSVLSLHREILHVVVPPGSEISGVSDFAGRRISSGNIGSGTRLVAMELASAYGQSEGDFDQAESLTMELQAAALCNGQVDAFITMNAVPAPIVLEAANDCDARLVPVTGPQVQRLLGGTSGLVEADIPAGSYPTNEAPVRSIGVQAGLVTRDTVPDSIVRDVVAAVMEELPAIRAAHAALDTLDRQNMVPEGHGAPLHPGARLYFTEHGLN